MKKIIALSILGFIICTAFNTPKKIITDYRDAYTGTYFCHSTCSKMDFKERQNIYTHDTVSFVISKDATDSIMQINLGGQTVKAKLVNKRLVAYNGGHFGGSFFAADSLGFKFSLGLISYCNYIGKKM